MAASHRCTALQWGDGVREHVSPANLFTSVGLGSGFGALLVTQDSVARAAALVMVAAALDAVDGMLARRSGLRVGQRAADREAVQVANQVQPKSSEVIGPPSMLSLLSAGIT